MPVADITRRRQRHTGSRTILPLVAVVGISSLLFQSLLAFINAAPGAGRSQQLRRRAVAEVAAPAVASSQLLDAKAKLLDLLEDETLEQEVLKPEGKPTRGRVDEAILQLERLNPSDEPVYSELLDGAWMVKYAGSYAPGLLSSPTRELALFLYGGGFSLGNALTSFSQGFWGQSLGLKLGAKKVRIAGGRDVDAFAEIDIAGRKESLSFTAELMPLSSKRMSEEIVTVDLPEPLGKQDLPLELRRSILVTYLDEELMVVRDESGVPEVLMRELAEVVPGPAGSSVVEPAVPASMPSSANDTVLADNATAEGLSEAADEAAAP